MLGIGLPKLRSYQKDIVDKAKKYAMEQSIRHIMTKQTLAHQQNQQKIAMYSQALSLMARCIENVFFDHINESFSVSTVAMSPLMFARTHCAQCLRHLVL